MALLFRTFVSLGNDLTLTIRRLPIISPFPERRIVKLLIYWISAWILHWANDASLRDTQSNGTCVVLV